jgi:predicted lysophospholipase L1 biosynthesis ABC-type transport system permease subunit
MMELMSPYLAEDQPQDEWLSSDTLSQAADHFAERLRQKFPELDAISIRSLANRRAFDYK